MSRAVAEPSPVDPDACSLYFGPPTDFGWCSTHDDHFPLGAMCTGASARLRVEQEQAREQGDVVRAGAAQAALDLDAESRARADQVPASYRAVLAAA